MSTESVERSTESMQPISVLVIDDERNIRTTLSMYLESMGCHVVSASTGKQAIAALGQKSFDLSFLDMRLGTSSGLDLLPELLAESPNLSIVILTAYATVDTAVEAVKKGAVDYLSKPFTPEQIQHVITRCLERRETQRQLALLGQELKEAVPEIDLDTKSPKMRAVLDTIYLAATSDAPVSIAWRKRYRENRTRANAAHPQCARRTGPFVVVNCPTLSEELWQVNCLDMQWGHLPARAGSTRASRSCASGNAVFGRDRRSIGGNSSQVAPIFTR